MVKTYEDFVAEINKLEDENEKLKKINKELLEKLVDVSQSLTLHRKFDEIISEMAALRGRLKHRQEIEDDALALIGKPDVVADCISKLPYANIHVRVIP